MFGAVTKRAANMRGPARATRNTRYAVCASLLALIIAGAASGGGAKKDLVIGRDNIGVTPDA